MREIWMEDARREERWDRWVRSRPVCLDCREHILEEKCLPVEGGVICEGCVRLRMVEISE